MNVIPDVMLPDILTAILLTEGTAVTGDVNVHLYTNNLVPTKASILADFTELTNVQVPGYATQLANWFAGTPFRRNDGAWESPNSEPDPSFIGTTVPPAPQVVYGYFLTDSTNAILLGAGLFSAPFTYVEAGDGFTLHGNPSLAQEDDLTLTLTLVDLQPT